MKRVFQKSQIFTIPNLLSLSRVLLIPLMIWLYIYDKNYTATAVVIMISAVTDVADGFIARHFNMITDFGKIIDPIADKLTQITIVICLSTRYRAMKSFAVLFLLKELIIATFGWLVIKKKKIVTGAKWYGKFNTVVIHTVLIVLIIFSNIPTNIANGLVYLCVVVMLLSLFMYTRYYIQVLSGKSE